jgi:uncharacterized protein DUF6624
MPTVGPATHRAFGPVRWAGWAASPWPARIRTLAPRGWGQYTALPPEVAAQWQRVDEDNTRWLADVVSTRGWPGRTLAGEDGAAAAWLLAQHADRDLVRQRTFLDALRGAAGQGEASPWQLAYLEDRVRVNAGQPQLYGPQFIETDGELGPHPVEEPHRLDDSHAIAGVTSPARERFCAVSEQKCSRTLASRACGGPSGRQQGPEQPRRRGAVGEHGVVDVAG